MHDFLENVKSNEDFKHFRSNLTTENLVKGGPFVQKLLKASQEKLEAMGDLGIMPEIPVFTASPNNFISEYISLLLTSEDHIGSILALRRTLYSFKNSQALATKFLSEHPERSSLPCLLFDMLLNEMLRLPVEKVEVIQTS